MPSSTCSAPQEDTFGRSKNKVRRITWGGFGPFDDEPGASGTSTASARSFDFMSAPAGSHINEDGTMVMDDTGPDNMFHEDPPPGNPDAMELMTLTEIM